MECEGIWMLGQCVKALLLTSFCCGQPSRRASHNAFLNYKWVIGTSFGLPWHACLYIICIFTFVISSKAQKMQCHHLWLRLLLEYDTRTWSAMSTLLIKVDYSTSMDDVGTTSLTVPFLCGTLYTGTQGNPIGNACVEMSKLGTSPSTWYNSNLYCHAWPTQGDLAHIFSKSLCSSNATVYQSGLF